MNLSSHYQYNFIHAGALMTKKEFSESFQKSIEKLARILKIASETGRLNKRTWKSILVKLSDFPPYLQKQIKGLLLVDV